MLLSMNVPIYGNEGAPVTLNQLLHFAFHGSPTEHHNLVPASTVNKLVAAAKETRETIASHVQTHNSSGGILDRNAGEYLIRLADLLDEIEKELRSAVPQQ